MDKDNNNTKPTEDLVTDIYNKLLDRFSKGQRSRIVREIDPRRLAKIIIEVNSRNIEDRRTLATNLIIELANHIINAIVVASDTGNDGHYRRYARLDTVPVVAQAMTSLILLTTLAISKGEENEEQTSI